VVFDDLLADRQAQARALGLALLRGALGGEERVEDLWDDLLGDAGPVSITWMRISSASSVLAAFTVSEPPRPSRAWRALIRRFSSTCSSWIGSPWTVRPGCTCTRSAMPSFCGSRASTSSVSSTSCCTATSPKHDSPRASPSIDVQIRPALLEPW
jgi:hypothetical protein